MTNDTDSDPAASLGSHNEPIGHQYVDEYGRPYGYMSWKDGDARWPKSQTVPLYLAPPPTLTDEEREAVEWAAEEAKRIADAAWFGDASLERRWVALRLLARRLG